MRDMLLFDMACRGAAKGLYNLPHEIALYMMAVEFIKGKLLSQLANILPELCSGRAGVRLPQHLILKLILAACLALQVLLGLGQVVVSHLVRELELHVRIIKLFIVDQPFLIHDELSSGIICPPMLTVSGADEALALLVQLFMLQKILNQILVLLVLCHQILSVYRININFSITFIKLPLSC